MSKSPAELAASAIKPVRRKKVEEKVEEKVKETKENEKNSKLKGTGTNKKMRKKR